ncbi:MAG TPA: histidine phosphatase family protein [Usitatibacter sp.]|nr:histidine phosphatase family protein [Usitatibacter sp.]
MTKRAGARFIVVRHGETRWNVEQRVQGHGDSPLTPLGAAQAEAIAARLARERFDALIASDLGRAMDTAARIGAKCGLEVIPDPRLRERSFGEGEGLGYAEIDKRWPEVFSRTGGVTDPDLVIPGGESRRQFHERVHHAFLELAREHAGKRVAVVAHGGVLAALYRIVHDIPVAHAHRVAISNASYNALAFDGDAWALEAWDDTAHLPEGEGFVES